MSGFVEAAVTGITAFVATNIDDIVILMLFFAQVNAAFRPRHIVIGQYLGFTLLIGLSLPGYFGRLLVSEEWIGLLGIVPIAIGLYHLVRQDEEPQVKAVSEAVQPSPRQSLWGPLTRLLTPQVWQVAAVTIANGGDNIGIYVPLFASSDLASLGVILLAFFLLVGVWCAIAYYLTRHPAIAHVLTRYGEHIVPFVLIGLGIFILIESGTYRLLPQFS